MNSRVLALIPAHNEADCIAECLGALRAQSTPPDWVVVIDDNSTDATAEIARASGAWVFTTKGNAHKKAGALNQALAHLLPSLKGSDSVLILDADSYLDSTFIEGASEYLADDRYSAVGGLFRGREGGGWVGWCQRNEFARYARDTHRLKGRTLCLTGTATLANVAALRDVQKSRPDGTIYGVENLTEDFELTLRLAHLGHGYIAPKKCTLTTEVMDTWPDLARQRLRWKRGAVEALMSYGLTRQTWPHIWRQAWGLVGITATALFLATLLWAVLIAHALTMQPLFLMIAVVFAVERFITLRRRGLRHAFAAATLIAEMPFDVFLQVTHLRAYYQAFRRSARSW